MSWAVSRTNGTSTLIGPSVSKTTMALLFLLHPRLPNSDSIHGDKRLWRMLLKTWMRYPVILGVNTTNPGPGYGPWKNAVASFLV
jgi:hypothetical protein